MRVARPIATNRPGASDAEVIVSQTMGGFNCQHCEITWGRIRDSFLGVERAIKRCETREAPAFEQANKNTINQQGCEEGGDYLKGTSSAPQLDRSVEQQIEGSRNHDPEPCYGAVFSIPAVVSQFDFAK